MRKWIIGVLIAAGTGVLWAQKSTDYSQDIGSPTDGRLRPAKQRGLDEAYLPVIAPSSHAANLIALKNGDLLCFWFTGTWEGESGVGIAVSRLARGSQQWTRPVLVDSKPGFSYQNPVPFQAPDGTMWLFHTQQPAGQGESDARVLMLQSTDDGKTWSAPKILFNEPGAFTRDPVVVMPDGGWLLPMYYSPKKPEGNRAAMKISHDRGRTWTECAVPESGGYVQPSVVRLPGNRYVALLRSRRADWIYQSTSSDGCHWTPPHRTSLPNNNASIQAVLLRDSRIVLAFNDSPPVVIDGKSTAGPRKPVTLAMSDDGGKTWRWKRDLETGRPGATAALEKEKEPGREEYSYPSVIQDPDGDIDVAFTYRRETVKFVRLPESWIESGTDARENTKQ